MNDKDLEKIKTIMESVVEEKQEKLVQIIAKGFEGVDKKFEEVNHRLVNIEFNIEQMKSEDRIFYTMK